MTSRAGGVIQDRNFNIHNNGVSSVARKVNATNNFQRKGARLSQRKPLADLSNSGKPVPDQAPEKQTMKNLTGASKMGNLSLAASKRVQTGSRRALSDISNSEKPNLNKESKKKQNLKSSAMAEELPSDIDICVEGFLHDHKECIKAQRYGINMDQFLNTVGHDDIQNKDSVASPNKEEAESPWRCMEFEEMLDEMWPIVDTSSPPRSKWEPFEKTPSTPISSIEYYRWKDIDVNFRLIETPKLPKYNWLCSKKSENK